jgi:2-methylaconitate isomerase
VPSFPATYVRGGDAKGLLFDSRDLPLEQGPLDHVLLAAMGSPDAGRAQLDGMGGGSTNTSKCALLRPSEQPGIDVEYRFAQVGIAVPTVDWTRSCGNLAAGVALHAHQSGLASGPGAAIRIRAANSSRTILADVTTYDVGNAADVTLTFDTEHDDLLPLGAPRTTLALAGRHVEVSVVDVANTFVLVWLGAAPDGGGAPSLPWVAETGSDMELLSLAQEISVAVGRLLRSVRAEASPPKVVFVAPPTGYTARDESRVDGADLRVFAVAGGTVHHSCPMTAALAVTAAAYAEDTVIARPEDDGQQPRPVRLGHPAGLLEVTAVHAPGEALSGIAVRTTARRLFEGRVFVPEC